MGNVRFGIPRDLTLELRDRYQLQYFVETGTYRGRTAIWASQHFDEVWTIEKEEKYFCLNIAEFPNHPNITFVLGDSRVKLGYVLEQIQSTALIWLDAHWVGKLNRPDDCPLREELAMIDLGPWAHVLMIDDAHYFQGDFEDVLSFDMESTLFPGMDEIYQMLPGYSLSIHEDVIVAVPKEELVVQ